MLEGVRRELVDSDVVFLGISLDPDVPSIARAALLQDIRMQLVVAKGEVMGPLHVGHMPSTVFVDRRGHVVAAVQGPRPPAFYQRRIAAIRSE